MKKMIIGQLFFCLLPLSPGSFSGARVAVAATEPEHSGRASVERLSRGSPCAGSIASRERRR